MMQDSRQMSSDELRAFLQASRALTFRGRSREKTYAWIERTLRRYDFLSRSRAEKGLLRQYLQKMTGLSAAMKVLSRLEQLVVNRAGQNFHQLTRLIAQFRHTGQVLLGPYRPHRFPTKFTRQDQLLPAEVDEAHDRLSGPATLATLKREYTLFGRKEFQRLSTYRTHTTYVPKTCSRNIRL